MNSSQEIYVKAGRNKNLSHGRSCCEKSAAELVAQYPGYYWRWVNDRQLCVFDEKHQPVANMHIE